MMKMEHEIFPYKNFNIYMVPLGFVEKFETILVTARLLEYSTINLEAYQTSTEFTISYQFRHTTKKIQIDLDLCFSKFIKYYTLEEVYVSGHQGKYFDYQEKENFFNALDVLAKEL